MGNVEKENRWLNWWEAIFLILGLFLFAGQALLSSPLKSASFDEEYHVAAGYAYLKTGDARMSLSHPPLVDALSAVPLLFRDDVNLPLDDPSWENRDYFNFSDVFLWQAQNNPQSILEWSRWPIILLGTILVAALFWWAREMAGAWAGWIALILAVFDPNLIANSRLVTTDLGLACFLLLAMWRLWHWLEDPSRKNLILVGVFAGLTMTAKFTGVMVWPMIVVVSGIWAWGSGLGMRGSGGAGEQGRGIPSSHPSLFSTLVKSWLVMGVVAFVTLWAVYGFDVSSLPNTSIPLPASFYPYSMWDTFVGIEEQPKTSFLLGETSPRGWWYYFPVALLVKTSLPLLGLFVWGTAVFIKQKGVRYASILWVPPLFYMLLAMTGRITIGYRHILPVVPFLILLAAGGLGLGIGNNFQYFGDAQHKSHGRRPLISNLIIVALLFWSAIGTLRIFPHQESFFNELAGGPENGGNLLVDSNIDWGQDLIVLRELMADEGIEEVYLGYFGTGLPEVYGVNYKPIPGFLRLTVGPEFNAYNPYTPLPGWYAISQTSLQLGLLEQNIDMYAFFREREPDLRAGYSLNLYKVAYDEDVPVDRVVVTGTSVSDVDAETLGVANGRLLITKWAENEATQIMPFTEPFSPPENFQEQKANFSDVLSLLGYVVTNPERRAGEPIELTLFWQRGTAEVPMSAPTKAGALAVFVHLSGEDPAQIVTQFDGWGTAVSGLEAGDMISQQVTLWPPAETPNGEYFLRVGLYSPQSGQRFGLADGSGDFVTLAPVKVRIDAE